MLPILLLLPFCIGVKSQSVSVTSTFESLYAAQYGQFIVLADDYDDNYQPTTFGWSIRTDLDENTQVTYEYKIGKYPDYTILESGTITFCSTDSSDPGGAALALLKHGLDMDENECPIKKFDSRKHLPWKIGSFEGNFDEVFNKINQRRKRQVPDANEGGSDPSSPSGNADASGGTDGNVDNGGDVEDNGSLGDDVDVNENVDGNADAGGSVDGDVDASGSVDGDVDASGSVDGDVDAGGSVDTDVDANGNVDGDVQTPSVPVIRIDIVVGNAIDAGMSIQLAS